jgi:two-component system, OmpR family, phosphate regulon sensor histidine kinase PhoR
MPVLTVPRRIFLYWLLLLVPTLVVGGGAMVLVRREQARLAERGAYADEARRAAIAARARLIAENVELLVGDVQNGLLDTLAADPGSEVDLFLEDLEKTNPLVRVAFRARLDGGLLRPDARTAGEDARGFVRRFARQFGSRPPWAVAPPSPKEEEAKLQQKVAVDESALRQDVSLNVAQVQSARRGVQELFKSSQNFNIGNVGDAAAGAAPSIAEADSNRSRLPGVGGERVASAPSSSSGSRPSPAPPENLGGVTRAEPNPAVNVASNRYKEAVPDRRGWLPVTTDGRLQIVGWVQPGGASEVRGAEIQIAELVRRMASALPAEVGGGEGYALRDDQGRVLHQSWAVARTEEPALRVPLAAALLPGWEVVAFLPLPTGKTINGSGLWGVGVLLVAIFVAAILAGGSLLLWQARRSEEEAVQKTSFVANVSHEFKTPLTTIRLYAELLEQGRVRDATQGGEYLRTIGRETQRLARLVNNALDFSRLEQGKKKYAREEIDLTAALGRLLDTHAPRLAEAGMDLRRDLPAAEVRVSTDRDALEQIVLNLLDNACKYAAGGGEVTVSVEAGKNGGAAVRVADRGPGVPDEHHERIFEKFHRVNDALTAEKTGAGLGLSIARQLARGLGGDLHYVPRAGGGAEFILELP